MVLFGAVQRLDDERMDRRVRHARQSSRGEVDQSRDLSPPAAERPMSPPPGAAPQPGPPIWPTADEQFRVRHPISRDRP